MKVPRWQLHDIEIQHYKQHDPHTGCQYYSFAALTGDTSLLKFEKDNSFNRFLLHVQEKGYLIWPLYSNRFQGADESFWNELANELQAIRILKLIVTTVVKGNYHTIAIEVDFTHDQYVVADPLKGQLIKYNLLELLSSDYADMREILVLDSGVLSDYREIPPEN